MRSYYAHLETTMSATQTAIVKRPILRASAIFPVFQAPGISSRILFMGYWMLKRNIQEIAAISTLRNLDGSVVSRQHWPITEAKTYRVELKDMLALADIPQDATFNGSLEIEFFSTHNFVFPYPATVINYYGPAFSTVVHTAQRVYNDYEDMRANSQTHVPESGFNIYADENREPFFGIINGPIAVPNAQIKMEFYNSNQEKLEHILDLGTFNPYETKLIFPAEHVDLLQFLNGKVGAAKIYFDVNWIFPRLLAGNRQRQPDALVVTHTYYDCTEATSDSDYWKPSSPDWHPEALMTPLLASSGHYTRLYFYPIYSPSSFFIEIEIYDQKGQCLGTVPHAVTVHSPFNQYVDICMNTLCQNLNISTEEPLGVRLIAHPMEGSRLPARIKIALDIGTKKNALPCNICTNLQPYYPPFETKPHSFKWCPLLADHPKSTLWIMNSSPKIHYTNHDEIELSFYREKDTTCLKRHLSIPPHGLTVIDPAEDLELAEFFEGQIGWVTAITTNPYTTLFYFSENASGVIGGDHGF